jgi:hypothetical protein
LFEISGEQDPSSSWTVRMWIGPTVAPADAEAARYLVSHLDIPPWQPSPGKNGYVDPVRGFTVEYPKDWQRASESMTPTLSSPVEIFAAGTYPLRPGGSECPQWPVNAIEDLGANDAFVWIAEAAPGGGFPDRPAHFPGEGPDQRMEARYCLNNPDKPYRQWWLRFAQGNRNFYAYVAMGADVSGGRAAEAWSILDSFTPAGGPSINPSSG